MTGLRDKIPDIKKTLETVQFLKLRRVTSPHVSSRRPRTTD